MKLYIMKAFHDYICSFIKKESLILKRKSEINLFIFLLHITALYHYV